PGAQGDDRRAEEEDEKRRRPDRDPAAQRRRLPVSLVPARAVNQIKARCNPPRQAAEQGTQRESRSRQAQGRQDPDHLNTQNLEFHIRASNQSIVMRDRRCQRPEAYRSKSARPRPRFGHGYHHPTVTQAQNRTTPEPAISAKAPHSTGRSGGQTALDPPRTTSHSASGPPKQTSDSRPSRALGSRGRGGIRLMTASRRRGPSDARRPGRRGGVVRPRPR